MITIVPYLFIRRVRSTWCTSRHRPSRMTIAVGLLAVLHRIVEQDGVRAAAGDGGSAADAEHNAAGGGLDAVDGCGSLLDLQIWETPAGTAASA